MCFVIRFFLQHPGGGALISDVAGKDCTKDFDDFGHSSDARQILKKLKVGELIEVLLLLPFLPFLFLMREMKPYEM